MSGENPFEYARTPEWVIERLLDRCWRHFVVVEEALDPCVGDGVIPQTVNRRLLSMGVQPPLWKTMDLDPRWGPVIVEDSEGPEESRHYKGDASIPGQITDTSLVVMNPPFSKAPDIVRACLIANPSASIFMLHAVGWVVPKKGRRELLASQRPDLYILPDRPDFYGKGGDSTDYAWFHFHHLSTGQYQVLDRTPSEVRKAAKPPKRCPNTIEMDLGDVG